MKFIICVFLRKIIVLGRFYREKCILDPQNVGELNSRFLIKKMFNWPKKFNKTFLQKNGDLGKFGKLPIGQILSDLDKFCFAELTQGRSF